MRMNSMTLKHILAPTHTPYDWQKDARRGLITATNSVIVVARQHGKTELAIEDMLEFALTTNRPSPNIAIIGPSIEQAEMIYWDRLLARFGNNFFEKYVSDVKTRSQITIQRPWKDSTDTHDNTIHSPATIRFFGVENGTAIEGQALDYALCDEVGLWTIGVLKTSVEPALKKKNGKLRIYGTPRGDNDLYTSHVSYQDFSVLGDTSYFSYLKNAYQLGVFTHTELDKIKQDYIKQNKLHIFNMAYMCDFFANVSGSVFSRHLADSRAHNKILPLTPQPNVPIHTVWDIGLAFTSCWVFQFYNGRYYMLKHWEWEDVSIEEYAPTVRDSGYQFAYHFLPHDAYHRNRNNKKTYAQEFDEQLKHNGQSKKITKIDHEEVRTQTARNLVHQCYFDQDGCRSGLEKLAQYKLQIDKKTGYMKNKIVKDKFSHTGDAFCQMFMIPRLSLQNTIHNDIMNRMQLDENNPYYTGKKSKRNYKQGDVARYGELYHHKKRGF